MSITHTFVSTKSEQPDNTLVGPNEWNASHTIASGAIAWNWVNSGKPFIVVTPNGPTDGGDYGPNTPGTLTAGIQEAINALSVSGGRLFIKDGVYVCSGPISTYTSLANSIDIEGETMMGTVIQQAPQTNCSIFFNTESAASGLTRSPTYNSFRLANLTMDFNYANQGPRITNGLAGNSSGVLFYRNGGNGNGVGTLCFLADIDTTILENVRFINSAAAGLNVGFFTNDSGSGATSNKKIFGHDLYGENNSFSFWLNSADNNATKMGHLRGLTAYNDLEASLYLDDGDGWNVVGCRITTNANHSGQNAVTIFAGQHFWIDDLDIDLTGSSGGHAIQVGGLSNIPTGAGGYIGVKRCIGLTAGKAPVSVASNITTPLRVSLGYVNGSGQNLYVANNLATTGLYVHLMDGTSFVSGLQSSISVPAGGSPLTYQAGIKFGTDEFVSVAGGTVTAIALSQDNTNFYTIASATGPIVYVPNGWYLKTTYNSGSQPTMNAWMASPL